MALNIILLGAPGSGKGTQAQRLASEYSLKHLSTGDLVRDHIRRGTEVGLKAKPVIDRGDLVSDDIMIELFEASIQEASFKDGFVSDGYPRTLAQAKAFDTLVEKSILDNPLIFYLEVEKSLLMDRILGRRTCVDCQTVYHATFNPASNASSCDSCGGDLIIRDDDTEERVVHRYDVFETTTMPILDYYRDRATVVSGDNAPDDVFSMMKETVEAWES